MEIFLKLCYNKSRNLIHKSNKLHIYKYSTNSYPPYKCWPSTTASILIQNRVVRCLLGTLAPQWGSLCLACKYLRMQTPLESSTSSRRAPGSPTPKQESGKLCEKTKNFTFFCVCLKWWTQMCKDVASHQQHFTKQTKINTILEAWKWIKSNFPAKKIKNKNVFWKEQHKKLWLKRKLQAAATCWSCWLGIHPH